MPVKLTTNVTYHILCDHVCSRTSFCHRASVESKTVESWHRWRLDEWLLGPNYSELRGKCFDRAFLSIVSKVCQCISEVNTLDSFNCWRDAVADSKVDNFSAHLHKKVCWLAFSLQFHHVHVFSVQYLLPSSRRRFHLYFYNLKR